ncbi:mitochondrial 54S ribosomal protein mL54 [Aspergillus ruber CBS 135680]|uniref:Large ribosomal subunit protein mL54 n=1 Tax=Aspergillus ruber (strain CBS 135680) TaxID=1388766 RepID=A0A017S1J9_ASPRC|nr:uncharacterized protein EURHEDRAFT_468165 [Aspergillus ruber CBS 135680]EYE90025.1 hypothetical protein EURHEDRAFT_468165 [Aspergillus ruber CBS 135680]
MICQRCRTGILSRLQPQQTLTWTLASSSLRQTPLQHPQFHQARPYSDNKPSVSATPPPPKPRQPIADDISIPSAVSSASPGVSQPLSTPGAVHADVHPQQPVKQTPKVVSSCAAGTKLNGLNYFKNKPDVFAREDEEYPEWLWGLLEGFESKKKAQDGGVDPSTLNKKGRKKLEKKLAAQAAALPPKIPVHHQATDITPASYNRPQAGDIFTQATESLEKRTEITKSAREARRKEIRESNFLRGL